MISCNLLTSSFSFSLQCSFLVISNPNLTSLPSPVKNCRLLCLCRLKDSSLDPNAESVRTGRFRFRDETSSGDLGRDFGRDQRRWWSDDEFREEFDSNYDDYDDVVDDDEQLWDKIWIFKVFKSYGYLLPAIIASILLATGPKAFLMALALPLGQSVISLAIGKLWGGGQDEPETSPRIKRKPFSSTSTGFKKQEQDERSVGDKRREVYQSWDVTENKDWGKKDSERPSFGGWDELDQQRRQVNSSKSAQLKMGKFSKKGRYRDAPLFLRLLIAVFPFLGSWIRIL